MSGELVDGYVVVKDQKEGSQLYNKGNYGYPRSRGGLDLDPIEALYLVECGRLDVTSDGTSMKFDELFNYSSSAFEDFDIKYMVYRDLRSRGFIVKMESDMFDMSVFPRGMQMSNSRPIYMVRAASERTAFDMGSFSDEVRKTEEKGKTLLYAVADEEGDIVYYKMMGHDPVGSVPPADSAICVTGHLVRDRVFIFDSEDSKAVRESGFYGKVVSNVLQLSLIEACFLMKRKQLEVILSTTGKRMSLSEMKTYGKDTQDEFLLRLKAYTDARERGLVVKTGLKYGTHFRAYVGSPDECHARYLMHAVSASNKTLWPEISRAVRLSGGVKKEFLFCRVGKKTEYIEFKWFRP